MKLPESMERYIIKCLAIAGDIGSMVRDCGKLCGDWTKISWKFLRGFHVIDYDPIQGTPIRG